MQWTIHPLPVVSSHSLFATSVGAELFLLPGLLLPALKHQSQQDVHSCPSKGTVPFQGGGHPLTEWVDCSPVGMVWDRDPTERLCSLMQRARDSVEDVEVDMGVDREEMMEVDVEESIEDMGVDVEDDIEDMEVDVEDEIEDMEVDVEDDIEDMDVDVKDNIKDVEVNEKEKEQPMILG